MRGLGCASKTTSVELKFNNQSDQSESLSHITGNRVQQSHLLAALVRGVALVGELAAAFGPAFAYTLLRLGYGQRWSDTEAPAALAAYSFYILLLAVNGILEVGC